MTEWIRAGLDLVLILIIGAGLVQATRLIRHLAGLRQGRIEMERFVQDFNATVMRAEAGIKGLRNAARESGDDLEKLVEKALLVRDELQFIVESSDQLADRLSRASSEALRDTPKPEARPAEPRAPLSSASSASSVSSPAAPPRKAEPEPADTPTPSSRAEKELLQALRKLS